MRIDRLNDGLDDAGRRRRMRRSDLEMICADRLEECDHEGIALQPHAGRIRIEVVRDAVEAVNGTEKRGPDENDWLGRRTGRIRAGRWVDRSAARARRRQPRAATCTEHVAGVHCGTACRAPHSEPSPATWAERGASRHARSALRTRCPTWSSGRHRPRGDRRGSRRNERRTVDRAKGLGVLILASARRAGLHNDLLLDAPAGPFTAGRLPPRLVRSAPDLRWGLIDASCGLQEARRADAPSRHQILVGILRNSKHRLVYRLEGSLRRLRHGLVDQLG